MSTTPAPPVRLLIVDDEVAQMKALCNTLEHEGYSTTGFTSAVSALAMLKEQRFDIVLTDLMMPEMDGIALLAAGLQIDSNLVGIVMTGHGTIGTAVQAMKTGALDYILKPFNLTSILPVLSRALTIRQLRLQNEELSQRVQERTAELETANKELEAFSYSVSHDLRAPLRAIMAYSEMMETEFGAGLPPEGRHFLSSVRTAGQRMEQLIKDLLALSRMSRQPLTKQPVQMASLVRSVVDELNGERRDRPVEVRVAELPDCAGDASLLKQVLVNLVSNAVKFSGERSQPLVEIGCSDGVYFVRDNGAGFDMKYADKLFGVFQRLHSGDRFEGTGIGLSIVQRIIQRHGGRIWAQSEPDKGATFHFTLP